MGANEAVLTCSVAHSSDGPAAPDEFVPRGGVDGVQWEPTHLEKSQGSLALFVASVITKRVVVASPPCMVLTSAESVLSCVKWTTSSALC